MAERPEFLIIGAARSGTTALHAYLRQHPQIFMPAHKEPNFFAFEGLDLTCEGPGADDINNSITRFSDYQRLFDSAPDTATCGEASPLYLYSERAPAQIKRHVPNARMVVILRNPVEQAFSHFMYATKQCIEPESDFTTALGLENKRLADNWQPLFGYSSFPRYAEQLSRYFAIFPKQQFLIRTYEDFQDKPNEVLKDIFGFIGVDVGFKPDMSQKLNAGGVPKNQALQNFLMKSNPITRAIGLVVPPATRLRIRDRLAKLNLDRAEAMPDAARTILHQRLDDEIIRLEHLIARDLSAWRQ